jgi:hypothetical protein
MADVPILTKHTPQVAAGQKNCSRTAPPFEAILFPMMRPMTRENDVSPHAALAFHILAAIHTAGPRANPTRGQKLGGTIGATDQFSVGR